SHRVGPAARTLHEGSALMSRSSVFEQNVAAPDRESGTAEPTRTAEPSGTAGPAGAAAPAGDPSAIGTPAFIVGAIALGLTLTGLVPASTTGSAVPIIVTATAMGQTIAAVWAARLGQDAIATVFGVFGGFWLSFAALALGLAHGWYGVTSPAGVLATEKVFQISWLTVFVLLTLFTFRLPLVFTAL